MIKISNNIYNMKKYYILIFILYIFSTMSLMAATNNTIDSVVNSTDSSTENNTIESLNEEISKNIKTIIDNKNLIDKNYHRLKKINIKTENTLKGIKFDKDKIEENIIKLKNLSETLTSNSIEIKSEKSLIEANTVRLYELLIKIHDNEEYLNKVFSTLVDIRTSLRKLSAKEIETADEVGTISTKEIWLVFFSILILSSAPLAFKKNTVDRGSIITWSTAFLGFTIIGFTLMYGMSVSGLFGSTNYLFINESTISEEFNFLYPIKEYFLFQVGGACLTSIIIFNILRNYQLPLSNYILISIFSSVLLYPIFGHWIGTGELLKDNMGWLGKLGFVDYSGAIGIYSLSAWFSLILVWKIKPITKISENTVILSTNSVILFWLVAIGLSIGSSLNHTNWSDMANIVFNLILAASLGAFSLYIYSFILKFGRLSESAISGGAISAIIAISASGSNVTIIEASIIASIASLLYLLFTKFLIRFILRKTSQKNAAEVISLFGIGGIWGTVSYAIFSSKGSFGFLDMYQLTLQLQGAFFAFLYAVSIAFLLAIIINIINNKYYINFK